MMKSLKYFLERTTPLGTLARYRRCKRFERRYIEWIKNGSVLPMPHFGKQQVVSEYAVKFNPSVFIETGTYTGHIVYAVLNECKEIYSIELDHTLAEKAKMRFQGYKHVHIIQGDSSEVLPQILKGISQPCLFWLDAHYSGGKTAKGDREAPIMQELPSILKHPNADQHVILIDDARCFVGQNNYPTLEELEKFIRHVHPESIFEVRDDIIRTHSKRPN